MGAAMVTIAPVPDPITEDGAEVFRADVEGETFVLNIADKVCTDTMSGMPFPKTVAVELGADTYAGCGGEPESLLRGTWKITAIDGAAPLPGTEPSISFDEDGKVGGAASCNRFFGSYTLTGEGLSLGQMGASMMMCDEPVMVQERAVLEILEATTGFAVADDGALTLNGSDGRTISASRTDDP
jgi:heat shock protein HslJ